MSFLDLLHGGLWTAEAWPSQYPAWHSKEVERPVSQVLSVRTKWKTWILLRMFVCNNPLTVYKLTSGWSQYVYSHTHTHTHARTHTHTHTHLLAFLHSTGKYLCRVNRTGRTLPYATKNTEIEIPIQSGYHHVCKEWRFLSERLKGRVSCCKNWRHVLVKRKNKRLIWEKLLYHNLFLFWYINICCIWIPSCCIVITWLSCDLLSPLEFIFPQDKD